GQEASLGVRGGGDAKGPQADSRVAGRGYMVREENWKSKRVPHISPKLPKCRSPTRGTAGVPLLPDGAAAPGRRSQDKPPTRKGSLPQHGVACTNLLPAGLHGPPAGARVPAAPSPPALRGE